MVEHLGVGRFAPSTTGQAHPGTLSAALLCWCDAHTRGMQVRLRLENLDPERCKPEYLQAVREQLAWFGLVFDAVDVQSNRAQDHIAALDKLADAGRVYACTCSRAQLREHAVRAPDGGWAYPNTCRDTQPLTRSTWRTSGQALRVRLDDTTIAPKDVGGMDLSQVASRVMGDPIVRRRDGAIAYQLAVVVDDAATGITHIVRGRDIAPSTATQVALMRLLKVAEPTYRHHFLLCESRGTKLAKFHGSVGVSVLAQTYTPEALCGFLAQVSGLRESAAPVSPQALLNDFSWDHVTTSDQLVTWDGARLHWHEHATSQG